MIKTVVVIVEGRADRNHCLIALHGTGQHNVEVSIFINCFVKGDCPDNRSWV